MRPKNTARIVDESFINLALTSRLAPIRFVIRVQQSCDLHGWIAACAIDWCLVKIHEMY